MRYIVFVRMLVEIRRFIFSLFLPASRVFSTSVFSLIALYLGVAWTSLCLSLSRRICRLSSRCYCVIRIRQLSRCLCSHTRIPGKRDYFSQFAKQMPSLCAALPWQEFVFASLSRFQPFFLFLWPSLPHRALVSPCRPATGFFFFFPPVYTTSCTRSRLFANTYEPRDSAFRLLSPCSPPSRRARAFVDTRRHAKRANPRTPGAAYFNQLAYVHCLLGVPDSLRYTSRNNDRTQQHSAAPSLFFVREQSIRDNNVALRSRDYANRVLFSLRLCPPPDGYQEGWASRIAARLLSRDILFLFTPKRFVVGNAKGVVARSPLSTGRSVELDGWNEASNEAMRRERCTRTRGVAVGRWLKTIISTWDRLVSIESRYRPSSFSRIIFCPLIRGSSRLTPRTCILHERFVRTQDHFEDVQMRIYIDWLA